MARILYIEDEPFLAKIVKESLESRNYVIKHLLSGENGLEEFRSWKPDICIFDVMLPTKDGFSVAQSIREEGHSVPIIFLTAKDQAADVLNGFKMGGNDYIKKPFSMEELIVRVENLLQLIGRREQLDTSIQWGKYAYRPDVMTLKFESEPSLNLSHRENEILKCFAKNQNQKVDRKELLLKVWGDDSFFNSRNLDVYIRKIRTYFSKDERVKIITLKGVGYHFYVEI